MTSGGVGITNSVVSGVQALLRGIQLDVRVQAAPLPGQPNTISTFIERIAVNAPGGNDEGEPGVPCIALNAIEQLADQWTGPEGTVLTAHQALLEQSPYFKEACAGFTDGSVRTLLILP